MKTFYRTLALAIAMAGAAQPAFAAPAASQPHTQTQQASGSLQLLDRNNSVLLLVDHQIGLITGVRDMDSAALKHNVVALAKAAQVMGIPVVVTSTGANGPFGPIIPELKAALPGVKIIDRHSVNAWTTQTCAKRSRPPAAKDRDRRRIAGSVCRVPGDHRQSGGVRHLCGDRCLRHFQPVQA